MKTITEDTHKISLGNTGLEICPLGFGGIPIQRLSANESDRVLHAAIEQGIDFFDTSRIYTDSETKMGRVFPEHRDSIVIASKTFSRDAAGAAADLDRSLAELKTDYIDIYQCHNISTEEDLFKILNPGGALEGLIRAQIHGKIGHIGITSHKPWILEKALEEFEFATIQIPFNIIENSCLEKLIPLARKYKTGIIAMKPVAGGALQEVNLNLRYILTSGADVAIPGMDSPQQVTDNLKSLQNLTPLSLQEMEKLNREKERLGKDFCRRCEYCMPCPEGLNIPFLHLIHAYYFRYNLKDWAWERLQGLEKKYSDCTACGACIQKCPYELNTPEIFKRMWDEISRDREK